MSERLVPPTCGAPAPYGGRWAARKWSKSDLGAWNFCNRRVKQWGDRCWQHDLRAALASAPEGDRAGQEGEA